MYFCQGYAKCLRISSQKHLCVGLLPGKYGTVAGVPPHDGRDSSGKPELGYGFENLIRDAGGNKQFRWIGRAHLEVFVDRRDSPNRLEVKPESGNIGPEPVTDMTTQLKQKKTTINLIINF